MAKTTYEMKSYTKPSKFKKFVGGVGAVGTSMLVMANAHALDISGALSGSSAKTDIETGALWALGIAVVIYGARKVIGFFTR